MSIKQADGRGERRPVCAARRLRRLCLYCIGVLLHYLLVFWHLHLYPYNYYQCRNSYYCSICAVITIAALLVQ